MKKLLSLLRSLTDIFYGDRDELKLFLFAGLFLAPVPFNRFRVLRPVPVSGAALSLGGLSVLPPASSPSLPVMDVRLLSPRHSSLVLTAALHRSSLGFFDQRFSQLHLSTVSPFSPPIDPSSFDLG
ncbi:hypothetical protein F2Q70_00030543 [Brassica cretica]|uniref:Uncharacterized protein n=2 Tax=Brassica cretica TaxID=69181 RepID=A0A3N6SJA9_BRACR|nr:hypothetical protein F2Q70_00030543 [Brassica cretica]KAF2552240.1 hypothetical protein F2Q68_00034993 [Brassica cretica]KAF3593430.1 hypothetical protein DY000_02023139 [Brassica cretica]